MIINKAKSTKVFYHKEKLDELYKYLNLIVFLYVYMSKKTKNFFLDLLYQNGAPLIYYL